MKVRGLVRIRAEGRELYRFINAMHAGSISCFGQYCRGEEFRGEVYRKDLRQVRELADRYGVSLSETEEDTLSARIWRHKKRWGILLGLAVLLGSVMFVSGRVASIEIHGNERVTDSELTAALEEVGIYRGADISGINFVWCENRIQSTVEGISWVGMHLSGNRIVVEVTETVEKPDMVRSRIPCNIVAAKSAEITYTSVLDGRLMHTVGEYVPRGTLLVTGVTTDDTGHTTLHHAMGSITGKYRETVIFRADMTQQLWTPTGRTDVKRRLRLFGLEIPLFFSGEHYDSSLSEESEDSLILFGKVLPISLVTETFTETAMTEHTYTAGETDDQLLTKMYLYEKNFLSGDTEILDRSFEQGRDNGVPILTVSYTLQGEIGEQMEILIK